MREWKTFNIISVLLLTAILTILQIQSAADDPVTRYTALFSLMCALISLLFGCMYIIRFGSMRQSYKAAEWAREAQKTKTLIWWNVWVLLAMPAIWLTWSIILYIACIMSFIWRSEVASTTSSGISDTGLLTIRAAFTVLLGVGLIYGILIVTTFRRYGLVMDKEWKQRIDSWIEENAAEYRYQTSPYGSPTYPHRRSHSRPSSWYRTRSPIYHRRSFDDAHSGYARDTYASERDHWQASDTYVPTPESRLSPTASSRSTLPTNKATRVNTIFNQLSNLQHDNNMTPLEHVPSPGTTPPPLSPSVPIVTAEETPPRRNRKKPYITVSPPILSPVPRTPITSFAVLPNESGLENRVNVDDDVDDDDVPDNHNRVRFRSPLISKQGSISLAIRYRHRDVEVEVPGRLRESPDVPRTKLKTGKKMNKKTTDFPALEAKVLSTQFLLFISKLQTQWSITVPGSETRYPCIKCSAEEPITLQMPPSQD